MLTKREPRRFTPEEYLLLEEQAEFKSEYCGGEIFGMTGGSLRHNELLGNLFNELKNALGSGSCKVYASDVRLLVERFTLFTYPDLMVVCGSPSLMKGRTDTLTDARVIAEVLSPSTESYDSGEKFRLYRGLPSLEEYVVIAQDLVRVERNHRQAAGGWLWTECTELPDRLLLTSLNVEIPLERIYRGVLSHD